MSFDRRFFSRQLVLEGFGAAAQGRLAGSHALVAGLGGTGGSTAVNLALAGVGRLTIVDRDVVSVENLHRQPLYTPQDVGMAKAEAAARFLSVRVPGLEVEYRTDSLDRGNAPDLLGDADIALDCLDNMDARYALNGACVGRKVPLVHTGSIGWEATVGVFRVPGGPCLECAIPSGGDDVLPSCEDVGTLGAVTSYAASLGSLEALKVLSGIGPEQSRIFFFDGLSGETRSVSLSRRGDCMVCGSGAPARPKAPLVVAQLCGDGEFFVSRAFPARSFPALARRLKRDARAMGDSIILVKDGRASVSLFRSGGALVRGVSTAEEAQRTLRRLGVSS